MPRIESKVKFVRVKKCKELKFGKTLGINKSLTETSKQPCYMWNWKVLEIE